MIKHISVSRSLFATAAAATLLVAGCVQQPAGPMVAVMPAPNKPFDVFQQDQATCVTFANQQVAGRVQQANGQGLGTAVLVTVLGAGLGAAVGGGSGAAIGAASGAVAGSAIGAGQNGNSQYAIQQSYDIAYSQCMYAKGNQVPGYPVASSPPPPPPPPQTN